MSFGWSLFWLLAAIAAVIVIVLFFDDSLSEYLRKRKSINDVIHTRGKVKNSIYDESNSQYSLSA